MHKTDRDHIISHRLALIGFLHQKRMDVVERHFMVLKLYMRENLTKRKFYKKATSENLML